MNWCQRKSNQLQIGNFAGALVAMSAAFCCNGSVKLNCLYFPFYMIFDETIFFLTLKEKRITFRMSLLSVCRDLFLESR